MAIKADLPDLRRRRLLAAGLGAAGLGAAGAMGGLSLARAAELIDLKSVPEKLKGSGTVQVCGFGGTAQAAQKKAYFEPFERLTGIKVVSIEGSDINKVKAMVETHNVEWDVLQTGRADVRNLQKKGDYFEKIDYDLVDTDSIDPLYRYDYSLDMLVWAEVMAYRTDAFGGKVPSGWADFWDTKTFPGDRTLIGGVENYPELEYAVMAAGVPVDKVYPIDVDLAFKSFDKIKPSIVKWWETGAVPVQMLTDREVVMASVWNGRMAALKKAGVPAEISWNQGFLRRDVWAVPKGTPNLSNAMKFVAFSTLPIPQATLSSLITYGFVNKKAAEYVSPEQLAQLPSAPEIKAQLLPYSDDWWFENKDAVIDRWNKWVLT